MPKIISPDEKISVIGDWLDGETRENIAIKYDIGSGTVYNIVQEWSNRIGLQKANVLRVLAVKIKNNGLTASDCAKGFRMIMIFKKYGIKEEEEHDGVIYSFFKGNLLEMSRGRFNTAKGLYVYLRYHKFFQCNITLSNTSIFEKEDRKKMDQKFPLNLYQKLNDLKDIQKEKEQEMQNLSENGRKNVKPL